MHKDWRVRLIRKINWSLHAHLRPIHRQKVEQMAVDSLAASVFQLLLVDSEILASSQTRNPTPTHSPDIKAIVLEITDLLHPPSLNQDTREHNLQTRRAIRALESIRDDIHSASNSASPEEARRASSAFHDRLNVVRRETESIRALKDVVKRDLDNFNSSTSLSWVALALSFFFSFPSFIVQALGASLLLSTDFSASLLSEHCLECCIVLGWVMRDAQLRWSHRSTAWCIAVQGGGCAVEPHGRNQTGTNSPLN